MKPFAVSITGIFLCMAVMTGLRAQTAPSYTPMVNDSLHLLAVKNTIRQQYLRDSASIGGENKKYIINLYRERFQSLEDMFSGKEFFSSVNPDSYLNSLVNEILDKNPELKKPGTRFLFSKAYWPNAFSTGEGTISSTSDCFQNSTMKARWYSPFAMNWHTFILTTATKTSCNT
jgi:hypothetical protein